MIFLLVRGLPWIIGIAAFLACQWQWTDARIYPWPLVVVLGAFCVATSLIAYRRLPLEELVSKMAPAVIALVSICLLYTSPSPRD